MSVFSSGIEFHVISCWSCTAPYAINDVLYQERHKDGKGLWCPSCGVSAVFSPSLQDDALQQARRDAAYQRTRAIAAERKSVEVNKQYIKIRNRIRKGMCPCCNEVFSSLARHMQTKHPEFGGPELLKALREAYGLTQVALAKELGAVASYVGRYEAGKRVPSYTQRLIAEWLSKQVTA